MNYNSQIPIETGKWDPADHITSAEDVAAYLEAAFEDGDAAVITAMLGAIARSRGMTQVARDAGVTREALYKSLSPDGDPRLSTLLGVLKALGLSLSIEPSKAA